METERTSEKITIGEKVRFFRKRAEMSQLELELNSELGTGVLSRVERDQINPTKETLTKIATALKLTAKETGYLLGINLYAIGNRGETWFKRNMPEGSEDSP